MTDTTTGESTTKKRAAIASRDLVDASGAIVTDPTKATGARYTYLATGTSAERQWGQGAGSAIVMCANMGWLTKIGNEVNSVKQADDYDGVSDPMIDAKEFDAGLDNGIWREAGEGAARGPKYDKDVLAGALLATLTADGLAKSDLPGYRARLDDKSYYAKVRANTKVMAQYYKDLAAKGGEQPSTDASGLA
jgi:hypothetical protein